MQEYIKWKDQYNTGHAVIDYQHRHLVYLINSLQVAIHSKALVSTLLDIIVDEVTKYTDYHFTTEEKIMESSNYSKIEEHKALHREFIKDLNLFKAEVIKGMKHIDVVFCDFLRDWLLNHIAIEDPKIVVESKKV